MSRRKLNAWELAIRDAARELGAPKDDFRVEKLATLTLLLKVQRSQWANGKLANSREMIDVMTEIETMRKECGLIGPRALSVQFVEGVRGICTCPKCGEQIKIDDPPPQTPTVDHENANAQPSSDAPARAPKVVPLVTYRDGVSASKFHSQVIAGRVAPPLKREQPSHYRSEAAERERHPYRDAAGGDRSVTHPLPVPHGVIR